MSFSFFGFFDIGFLYVTVLAVLELALVDQAGLKLTEIHLCFLSVGIKGVPLLPSLDIFFFKGSNTYAMLEF